MLAAPCRIVHDANEVKALARFLGHNKGPVRDYKTARNSSAAMPTLFRFLMILGLIASVVTGSLYVLAEYFQPEPKEISKALRNVKGRMEDQTASTPSPSADAGNTAPGVAPAGAPKRTQ
jgi:hypothetical protein